MQRAPDQWVFCRWTGQKEPPRYARLVERLVALNPTGAKRKPEVFIWHADQIYGASLLLRGRNDRTGHRINSRNQAVRIAAKRGTAQELKRLLIVARGGSASEWRTAWLGVSGPTRNLVWKLTPPPIIERDGAIQRAEADTSGLEVIHANKLHMVIPRGHNVVAQIEAALSKLEATPAAERKKRTANALSADFRRAVEVAFHDLTGKQRGAVALHRQIIAHLQISR